MAFKGKALGCYKATVVAEPNLSESPPHRSEVYFTQSLSDTAASPEAEQFVQAAIAPFEVSRHMVDQIWLSCFYTSVSSRPGTRLGDGQGLPLEYRDRSLNRLIINIGCTPRYLTLLPSRLSEGPNEIRSGLAPTDRELAEAIERLARRNLSKAVAVEISPDVGILMPVEDVLHDGSNIGSTTEDVVLLVTPLP